MRTRHRRLPDRTARGQVVGLSPQQLDDGSPLGSPPFDLVGEGAQDLGGDRSQSPEFLRVLADQVERWSPERGAVVKLLRAQADHVVAGGDVRESPVARAHLARAR